MTKKEKAATRMERSAWISSCGMYRYSLTRRWGSRRPVLGWTCWNPSDADHEIDDNSARRMIGFTRREGYDAMEVGNIYGLRSRDPKALKLAHDPVGPMNLSALARMLIDCDKVIVGWGAGVDKTAKPLLEFLDIAKDYNLWCLGTTKSGMPRHPLYLRNDAKLEIWKPSQTKAAKTWNGVK